MGTVFKGLLVGQGGFQRPLVIKQVRNPAPDQIRMFVEEARRYALLDHENIGRIFDFEEVRGEPCIILEYIDGWTVVEYLERHREDSQPPDVELSVFIASRVCRALQYVFERAAIVHRDVSPSNIMMTREGTVKLIDFGIATRSGTRDSALTGKPSYMAPEMVVELRADLGGGRPMDHLAVGRGLGVEVDRGQIPRVVLAVVGRRAKRCAEFVERHALVGRNVDRQRVRHLLMCGERPMA